MNISQMVHRIASIRLGPIEAKDGPNTGPYWVRTLTIEADDGSELRLELFASERPGQLSVDIEAMRPLLPTAEQRLDRYAVQAREIGGLNTSAPGYLLPRDCSGVDPATPGADWTGTVDLRREAAPQARFQVGDKVTPLRLTGHANFLLAGGIYTVDCVGRDDAGYGGLIGLQGMAKMWPASQFRLADPDPLAASHLEAEDQRCRDTE